MTFYMLYMDAKKMTGCCEYAVLTVGQFPQPRGQVTKILMAQGSLCRQSVLWGTLQELGGQILCMIHIAEPESISKIEKSDQKTHNIKHDHLIFLDLFIPDHVNNFRCPLKDKQKQKPFWFLLYLLFQTGFYS